MQTKKSHIFLSRCVAAADVVVMTVLVRVLTVGSVLAVLLTLVIACLVSGHNKSITIHRTALELQIQVHINYNCKCTALPPTACRSIAPLHYRHYNNARRPQTPCAALMSL